MLNLIEKPILSFNCMLLNFFLVLLLNFRIIYLELDMNTPVIEVVKSFSDNLLEQPECIFLHTLVVEFKDGRVQEDTQGNGADVNLTMIIQEKFFCNRCLRSYEIPVIGFCDVLFFK
jgi:hypothetical protein